MPLLCVDIECLRTRCGGCRCVQYERMRGEIGMNPRCSLFVKSLRHPEGYPFRLKECLAAEERGKLSQAIRAIAARSGVV